METFVYDAGEENVRRKIREKKLWASKTWGETAKVFSAAPGKCCSLSKFSPGRHLQFLVDKAF